MLEYAEEAMIHVPLSRWGSALLSGFNDA